MNTVEHYTASVPDWASSAEFVVHDPKGDYDLGKFSVREKGQTLFLVAVVSTPNGLFPSFLDSSIQLTDPYNSIRNEPHDNEIEFVSSDRRLIVINHPKSTEWSILAKGNIVPYSVSLMAFHPAIPPKSPPSPGPTAGSPFKCRACKTTTKALALAIVAAATLPALPSALIAAVSAYLGASVVIAAAFISSVLGDTADVIAEKLCKRVGLC
jgi:hypothetical protein